MDMKYYYANSYSSLVGIDVGGHNFRFDKVRQVVGRWHAVFATDDPKAIELLDSAVGTRGISEITEDEYIALVKKKRSDPAHIHRFNNPVNDSRPNPSASSAEVSRMKGSDNLHISRSTQKGAAEPVTTAEPEAPSLSELTETQPIDQSPPPAGTVTSQSALAEALGISMSKFNSLNAKPGAPDKHADGYHVDEWMTHRDLHR
jgi:hypothetical protein